MKILLYLAAGNGDLINFTGILHIIKCAYPDYIIDFLVLKKQSDILKNNPCINNILYFEDYPNIPNHCTLNNHDSIIFETFSNKYNYIFNCWACKIKDLTKQNYDYADVMGNLFKEYGFKINYNRIDIQPVFYYNDEDHTLVKNSINNGLLDKKIILFEEECFSEKNLQKEHNDEIKKYLKDCGYILAGNNESFDINVSSLTLRNIKLFFEKFCYAFLGLSSGVTCAIYAYPTFYINKKIIISGQVESWDFSRFIYGNKNYYYFNNFYNVYDIKSIL
jgi:hypothetical protein